MPSKARTIVFFHPDLGIGGAERLVVDAAVGLQELGHKVTIFTSHRDTSHCFDEARDGTLDVRVRGGWLFPPSVLGRFTILCAILRQLHLLLHICIFSSELDSLEPTVFFVDQLSACVPILRGLYPNARTVFYCHFPDKLLAKKGGLLKFIYRLPFNYIEKFTTGVSDAIIVNSEFTQKVFRYAFWGLRHRKPKVIYPCVDVEALTKEFAQSATIQNRKWKGKKVILSINRYERKKNIELAIKAFAGLGEKDKANAYLVIAGGYDPRMDENVAYHEYLRHLSESLKLKPTTSNNLVSALSLPDDVNVVFLLSIPSSLKTQLLSAASLLVYTPPAEHFGIVPLEAMMACVPVLAANTGGPTETVLDGQTGWLRDTEAEAEWTEIMHEALDGAKAPQLNAMGEKGRKRVQDEFSKEHMSLRFQDEIDAMMALTSGQRPSYIGSVFFMFGVLYLIGMAFGWVYFRITG